MRLISYNSKMGSREIKKDRKTNELREIPLGTTAQYVWMEKSYLFQFPLKYYYLNNQKVGTREPNFNMFLTGFPFFVFLGIGGVFGVFFKKRTDMDKRAAVFSTLVGVILIILTYYSNK